jgi:adenylate kinase
VSVDLDGMAERFPRAGRSDRLLVGHLAHLLPVRDVLLLRCHPLELDRRLRAARRGTARSRYENVASEAIDLILVEARARRRRVWEVDTTARSPASVARELLRHLSGRSAPSSGRVRWLTDPRVTDYLLRRSP